MAFASFTALPSITISPFNSRASQPKRARSIATPRRRCRQILGATLEQPAAPLPIYSGPRTVRVRPCTDASDADDIYDLVMKLAVFEREADSVKMTASDYRRDGFETKPPLFFAALAEEEETGEALGVVLCFYKYSTWMGRTLHVEDLFVLPDHRRRGIGKMLFEYVKMVARDSGCARVELNVLDWNTPAIEFYKKEKFYQPNEGSWWLMRLDGSAL